MFDVVTSGFVDFVNRGNGLNCYYLKYVFYVNRLCNFWIKLLEKD